MTTSEKTAANAISTQPATAVGQPTDRDYQRFWGDRILRRGIGGVGLGAGAASLYYLARGLSQALNQPKVEEEEEETPKITETKIAGLYDSISEGVGKSLPDSLMSFVRPFTPQTAKQPNSYDPNAWRSSFGNVATVAAGGLGAYGGYKLIEALHNRKKKQERQQEIDAAEKEYYDALVGGEPAKKLDDVYDSASEKAATEKTALLDWLTSTYDVAKRTPAALGSMYVGAGLGLGGLAAKVMYDRARERSKAKAVEEAAKSKARIAGILPAYVDPDEIVALKQRAEQAQAG
jgi:hypothetical protein